MILILGGTTEGRRLADALASEGVEYEVSLAGRTTLAPAPHTRVGGFGGADGLARYLRDHQITACVDATHPFAATMHTNAVEACARGAVPLLRLARPSWRSHPLAKRWQWVASHEEALRAIADAETVLLTIGRQEAARYADHPGRVLVRVAELRGVELPAQWEVIEARGPFTLEAERALLDGIDVLVSKDAGGHFNEAKLRAADELGVRVVMIARPPLPTAEECSDVREALAWVRAHTNPSAAT